jgi:hypothetical protein
MVGRLFEGRPPKRTDALLDPGCGTGAFLEGVIRWCNKNHSPLPAMLGIESEPRRARQAEKFFNRAGQIEIRKGDFLTESIEHFDFVIGNPPYVSIYNLTESEKREFRLVYETARGRFDLYMLFFERALKSLKPDGRLVFITPEKFLYVETAAPLRRILSRFQIEDIRLIDEQSFEGLVTYPTITTVVNRPASQATSIRWRDGTHLDCRLSTDGTSWMPIIQGASERDQSAVRLNDLCIRLSCGVATGADDVFVRNRSDVKAELATFAYPAISGRALRKLEEPVADGAMLIPYSKDSTLIAEHELGALGRYLSQWRGRLLERTCARRKPWYAFHETPPLQDILQPKILCKDIAAKPYFWIDREGTLIPRHSVYYIVPREPALLEQLCSYLNSESAADWLAEHCQRAANGFLRLQSRILKAMPVPESLRDQYQGTRESAGKLESRRLSDYSRLMAQ